MKKILPLIVFTCLFFTVARCQNQWSIIIDSIQGKTIVPAFDHGFVVCGSLNGAIVLKVDSSGNYVWEKVFGTQYETFECMTATSDSCYVVAGQIYSGAKVYYVKLDNNGDTVWTHAISFSNAHVNSICETYDKGFLVTGTLADRYMLVFKTDSSGNIQWCNRYSTNDFGSTAYTGKQSTDSCFYIGGSIVDTQIFSMNGILMKLSADGNVLWAKAYHNNNSIQIQLNEFIFDGPEIIALMGNSNFTDICKLDSNGYVISTRLFEHWYEEFRPDIGKLPGNRYLVNTSGYVGGTVAIIDSAFDPVYQLDHEFFFTDICITGDEFILMLNNTISQMGLIKLDTALNSACMPFPQQVLPAIIDTMQSDSVAFTVAPSYVPSSFNLAMTNTGFLPMAGCIEMSVNDVVNKNNFILYPNPSVNELKVSFIKETLPDQIKVYSMEGKLINSHLQVEKELYSVTIYHHLQPGVYYLEITSGSNRSIEKFVVIR